MTCVVPSPLCCVSLACQSLSFVSYQGLKGAPKFLDASLCTCHSLMTPEILHTLTLTDAFVLTSVYVKTLVDLKLHFEAVPTFRCCEHPAACTILCFSGRLRRGQASIRLVEFIACAMHTQRINWKPVYDYRIYSNN